jgi:hypothetical protein
LYLLGSNHGWCLMCLCGVPHNCSLCTSIGGHHWEIYRDCRAVLLRITQGEVKNCQLWLSTLSLRSSGWRPMDYPCHMP